MARLRLTEHFYADELWCKHCGVLRLHPGFVDALQAVRTRLNMPMHPTSGCRCAAYNTSIGGHTKSLHVLDVAQHPGQLGTLAVDVACLDGGYRGTLFAVAWDLGWSIGWNATRGFLHLDRRVAIGLPQHSFDY